MTTILSEKKLNKITSIEIFQDEDPMSPFDWDLLGEVIFSSKLRYNIGKCLSDEGLSEQFKKDCKTSLYLPLYAYIHSGISLSCSNDVYPFNCRWDTSYAGYIHVPVEKVRCEYNVKRITQNVKDKVYSCLKSEIETINQWLNGEVYGFVTKNVQGDMIDSCWGFYGSDPFTNGISEHIDSEYHNLLRNAKWN